MSISPRTSITGLVFAANLFSPACTPIVVDFYTICYTPLIEKSDAAPAEAYVSDSVTITTSLYSPNSCISSTYTTVIFPDDASVDITAFPGYDTSLEGVLLTPTNDTNPLTYTTSSLPLTSFSSGSVLYRVTAVSGYPAEDHSSTLDNYFTVLSADTADTGFATDTARTD